MRAIRLLIHGIPLALVALFAVAFISTTQLSTRKKNEFNFASIAEPTKLNPILSTDISAREVEKLIFEPLLEIDENLEFQPKLAKSYRESQRTTIYFANAEAAARAEETLRTAADKWSEWKLAGVTREGDRLILNLTLPGLRPSEEIVRQLDASQVLPVAQFRAETGGDARGLLTQFKERNPDVRIVQEWFDYDLAFEISVLDPDANALSRLSKFLAESGKSGEAAIEQDRWNFTAEPVIHFVLHGNVRWQDGAPFTAEDCVFTYECIVSEECASPNKASFDPVGRVAATSPHDFEVTYRRPYSPAIFAWADISIIPAHILRGRTQQWWSDHFNRSPVGTGPFKFDEWRTNEYVRLVRNPIYWGAGPWLDAFVFRAMPDPTVLRLAFETHQLDIYEAILSQWAIKSYENDPRFTVLNVPGFSFFYIAWNLRKPVFRDVRVRQAFAHAINVPELIEYVFYGNGEQSRGTFSPDFWFADKTLKPFAYDPERAKELLDEAGWKVGRGGIREKDGQRLAFKLITNQGNEARRDVATLVQDSLRRIGVDVKIEIYEWAVFIQRFILKQEFEGAVFGLVSQPNWDVSEIWHSSQTNEDQMNFIGYMDPEADRLITELKAEYDRDRIAELAGQLQRKIYNDQPALFLSSPNDPFVIWKDSLRIRRKTPEGDWIDTPFQVVPFVWNYFGGVTYRTEFADQLPPETAPK